MNPDNLINPFIVYWDINSSGYSDNTISNICDGLIKGKIFVLNLRDLSKPISPAVIGIIDKLAGTHIKIRLTVHHDNLERSMIMTLKDRGVSLFTETDSIEKLQSAPDNIPDNVSFSLNKKSFHEIPAVIFFCMKNQVTELEFPIQRAEGGEIFYLAPDNIDRLYNELKAISFEKLRVMVHDPFLWQVFNNREQKEGMGCNGANTMVYFSPDLDVTPCPLLPLSMGSLQAGTLKEIISSDKRRQIMTELSLPPQECRECAMVDNCRGGCRGRTYVLLKAFDKKDPACRL